MGGGAEIRSRAPGDALHAVLCSAGTTSGGGSGSRASLHPHGVEHPALAGTAVPAAALWSIEKRVIQNRLDNF